MPRPKKNNLDYFTHDNGMRNDRKIKAVRAKFGINGYAIYNMLLEILCESELLIIKWDEIEIELISGDLTIVSGELTTVSEYLIQIGLLKRVNNWLFCPQLDKRASSVFDKRIHDLDSLRKINGINITETQVSGAKSTHSKVKESKVKKRERKFIPPTLEEFTQYFIENDYSKELALRAWKGYEAGNWFDSSGKKILNWKQKAQHVWFKNENQHGNNKTGSRKYESVPASDHEKDRLRDTDID